MSARKAMRARQPDPRIGTGWLARLGGAIGPGFAPIRMYVKIFPIDAKLGVMPTANYRWRKPC